MNSAIDKLEAPLSSAEQSRARENERCGHCKIIGFIRVNCHLPEGHDGRHQGWYLW